MSILTMTWGDLLLFVVLVAIMAIAGLSVHLYLKSKGK